MSTTFEAQRSALRDKTVLACLAVVGLSLFSAYIMVVRDAVRQGDLARAAFAQQQAGAPASSHRPDRSR